MEPGYVGILSVELHFPEADSLKGKRKFVHSAKAQLQNRFGASVAEVDHHELWQRTRLTLACVWRVSLGEPDYLDGRSAGSQARSGSLCGAPRDRRPRRVAGRVWRKRTPAGVHCSARPGAQAYFVKAS